MTWRRIQLGSASWSASVGRNLLEINEVAIVTGESRGSGERRPVEGVEKVVETVRRGKACEDYRRKALRSDKIEATER